MSGTTLALLSAYVPTPIAHQIFAFPEHSPDVGVVRRSGAVLFADVSGFTSLTERLAVVGAAGTEELTRLLNHHFEIMIGEVEGYGGQTIKFSGDAFTALFPASDGLAAAAGRAISAASALLAAMGSFGEISTSVGEAPLGLKIGIGAGEVLTPRVGGVQGRWEYVLAGEAVRQAAEAETVATPSQVVLSAAAYTLLEDTVWGEALPRGGYLIHGLDTGAQRRIPPRLDWSRLNRAQARAAEQSLRAFIPDVVISRLTEGQETWLAELRHLTTMFIGISGLEQSAETIVPQLQQLVAAAQHAVYGYDGTISKLLVDDKGTVLMVLFGAPPLAHEDDPLRAVTCAADLHRIAREQGLRMAIGIASGTVLAGPIGSQTRREYTVIGDGVNLAMRLMQAAGAAGTLVDYASFDAVRDRVLFEPLEPLKVKGKQRPVRTYRPLVGDASNSRRLRRTPLVGRSSELASLSGMLDAIEDGQLRLVTLIGEAGIGKSRLINELTELIRLRRSVGFLAEALSTGQRTPYLVWRHVLRDYFGLDAEMETEHSDGQVFERIIAINPGLRERAALINDILGTQIAETGLTRALSANTRRESLAALVAELLGAWMREGPIALVLEDMQWADPSSWELTIELARRLAEQPLLLLLSLRPIEPEQPAAAQLRRLPVHQSIYLGELSHAETRQLAAARLGVREVPPALGRWLAIRNYGNPFYIEQLIDTLDEQGLLLRDGERCVLIGEPDMSLVPPTAQGLVQSRLDRLPADIRLTGKIAAVIGRSFALRILNDIHPMRTSQSALGEHIAMLQHLALIAPERDAGEQVYRFVNPLTQEVAYQSLLFSQRQSLHAAVAAWYEREYAGHLEPYVALLAEHYARAGLLSEQVRYTEQAGLQAYERYANIEALNYCSQAIELLNRAELQQEPQRLIRLFTLHETRVALYERLGEQDPQFGEIEQLVRLSVELRDDLRMARAQWQMASFYRHTNDFRAASEAASQAFELARRSGDDLTAARSMDVLGLVSLFQGSSDTALHWNDAALALARRLRDDQLILELLNSRQTMASTVGDFTQAEQVLYEQLSRSQQLGDPLTEANAINGLGIVAEARGDISAAADYFQSALERFRSLGYRRREPVALTNLGLCHYSLGDYQQAQAQHSEALAIFRQVGNQRGIAVTQINLANTLLARNESQPAQELLRESLAIAQTLGEPWIAGYALNGLGRASEVAGDLPAAAALFGQALEVHSSIEQQPQQIEDLAGLARVALARGDTSSALGYVEHVLERLEQYGVEGMEFAMPVYLSCVRVLLAAGQTTRASEVLTAGKTLLQERAERIGDPQRRAGFLNEVAVNAEFQQLCAAQPAQRYPLDLLELHDSRDYIES